MNLPVLIQQLTGTFTLTGLYSFEFVDKKRNTITEIFFMIPPKKKDVTEITRSTTNPTLSSNYNTDAGNGTKTINLQGELYFPYVGDPKNPVARDSSQAENPIDGMTEFFKLIDKVSKIDPEAGVYLGNVVNDINLRKRLNVVNSEFLMTAFMWANTEQGKSFWRNFYNKLEENNG